jgi:hypothetical protein
MAARGYPGGGGGSGPRLTKRLLRGAPTACLSKREESITVEWTQSPRRGGGVDEIQRN